MSPSNDLVRIKALAADGATFWHTGRAGALWVSPNEGDAVRLFNLEGARRFAARHNSMSAVHGLRFVAVAA